MFSLIPTSVNANGLGKCLKACDMGEKAMKKFCRGLPSPKLRALCWSVVLLEPAVCKGFCYNNFSRRQPKKSFKSHDSL